MSENEEDQFQKQCIQCSQRDRDGGQSIEADIRIRSENFLVAKQSVLDRPSGANFPEISAMRLIDGHGVGVLCMAECTMMAVHVGEEEAQKTTEQSWSIAI